MGEFSKRISERSKDIKVDKGYCLICGTHGHLSFDHVPPKGVITIPKVVVPATFLFISKSRSLG